MVPGLVSVTGMLNVPALALTVSAAASNCTVVGAVVGTARSSNLSTRGRASFSHLAGLRGRPALGANSRFSQSFMVSDLDREGECPGSPHAGASLARTWGGLGGRQP